MEWEWGIEQETAMEDLKGALLQSPALKPLDYKLESPVILAIDTSYTVVEHLLCQCSKEDVKWRNYN